MTPARQEQEPTVTGHIRQGEQILVTLSDGSTRPWDRRKDPPPELKPTIEIDRRTMQEYQPLCIPGTRTPYAESQGPVPDVAVPRSGATDRDFALAETVAPDNRGAGRATVVETAVTPAS